MSGVSVVIPTYDRAALLVETVRSVLAQTLAPLEVIVVDDGSTDDTPAVCAGFPAPVRVIRQPNAGLPSARNTGIRAARGAWVALCDSDDLWHPRKLQVQLAALEAVPGARWSLAGCSVIDEESRPVALPGTGWERVFPVFRERGTDAGAHFAPWLRETRIVVAGQPARVYGGDAYGMLFLGNVALPSSALFDRALVAETGMFDPVFVLAEETEFFHRLAAAAPVALVEDPLVEYRMGHVSMVSSSRTVPYVRWALRSLRQAAALRPAMTDAERAAYAAGRRSLRMRLAYAKLSELDTAGARLALREQWRDDGTLSPRAAALLLATLLPPGALRGLHRVKRSLRR
jgi:glycosyltransferase involved in cell wall biosynthesis